MQVRLLKVLVRPVFVLDDGESLTEVLPVEEHAIPASEWPDYSSERFPREVARWQALLDAQAGPTAAQPVSS